MQSWKLVVGRSVDKGRCVLPWIFTIVGTLTIGFVIWMQQFDFLRQQLDFSHCLIVPTRLSSGPVCDNLPGNHRQSLCNIGMTGLERVRIAPS